MLVLDNFRLTSSSVGPSSQRPRPAHPRLVARRQPQSIVTHSLSDSHDLRSPQEVSPLLVTRSHLLRQGFLVLAVGQAVSSMQCCSSRAAVQDEEHPGQGLAVNQVRMESLKGCQLAIGMYPTFAYNASGGGGIATATPSAGSPSRVDIVFDATAVTIPDVTYRTARVTGVPLPPVFKIRVQPESLQGWIDKATGEVQLDFVAKFYFTATSLYKAEPLLVTTRLTTGEAQGQRLGGKGELMDKNGYVKLVGVALVQPSGSTALDKFLRLPDDTLAVMACRFIFPPSIVAVNPTDDLMPAENDAVSRL